MIHCQRMKEQIDAAKNALLEIQRKPGALGPQAIRALTALVDVAERMYVEIPPLVQRVESLEKAQQPSA